MPASVSVVVCAYTDRRWESLRAACTAAAGQLRAGDQLLLVVDHNDALLHRAELSLPGVDVHANDHARGLSGARNTALDKAVGDVVVFLDDDATPRPGWLAALREPYADPGVYGVGGWAVAAWPDERRPAQLPPELDWIVGCSYTGLPTRRAPVRNLMGCNMSLRREVFDIVGGFDENIGRVGNTPLGCEETQLCIRLRQARPDVTILIEPDAIVDHVVSPDRTRWSYLRRRAYAEGVSKALIGNDVGRAAMSTEIAYTRQVLPSAVRRDLRRWLRGEHGAGSATLAVPVALGAFAAGYLGTRMRKPAAGAALPAPVHVVELDVAEFDGDGNAPAEGLAVPDGYGSARLLLRRGASVLGVLHAPTPDGRVPAAALRDSIAAAERADAEPSAATGARPSVAVVIATAGRPASVRRCVASLLCGTEQPDEIVLVDNAPGSVSDATALQALAASDERIRYLAEPPPGASRARNTGVAAATTEVVATVDDDVVVDRYWLAKLRDEFADPAVTMVTGLVQPLVLDTAAQVWFEQLGGFGKGFRRRVFRADDGTVHPLFPYSPGMVGSGNNLAFRRASWDELGGMCTRLGPGTAVPSGEDLDLFLRHLLGGGVIVYTPDALVWHEHRRGEDELIRQLHGYGLGLSAVFAKLVAERPGELPALARRAAPGLRRLVDSSRNQPVTSGMLPPATLRRAELRGFVEGPFAYRRASRRRAGAPKEVAR